MRPGWPTLLRYPISRFASACGYCALITSLLALALIASDRQVYGQETDSQTAPDSQADIVQTADDAEPTYDGKSESVGTIAYWVEQLGHEHFLRREIAAKTLVEIGPDAIEDLVIVIRRGELEVVERATDVITEIAITRQPNDDGDAWQCLNKLAKESVGRAASRAASAVREVREHRAAQARTELSAAGVFVGMDEFVIRAISQPRILVQVDEKWRGDVDALQWLAWLEGVKNARVKGAGVSKVVLQHITTVPGLKSLAIVDGKIDDESLLVLKEMKPINELEFRYVPMTDEQGNRIAEMPVRVSLNLMGTGISNDRVESMRRAAPGLQIDHRQGGFLGVTCMDGFDVCEISGVIPKSAAEDAGLIKGDIVTKINDTEVSRFRDLQQAINQCLPEDEVKVTFQRGDQTQTVPVRLGRFEEQ